MPDEKRKPRAVLHTSVPKDIRDFVRCRRDSIDIAPRDLDLPNLPKFSISFGQGPDGSVRIIIDAPIDFLDTSIPVSVDSEGHLEADTSKIPVGRDFVDQWIEDFNSDLDAPPKKKLTGVSVKNGKLHVTKASVVAADDPPAVTLEPPPMVIPPPPAHVIDPIPPPVKVEAEEIVSTTEEIPDLTDLGTDVESGVEEDPPLYKSAHRLRTYATAGGGVILAAVTVFLFTNNRGDDVFETPTTEHTATASTAAAPTTAPPTETTAQQTAADPPASVSMHTEDPSGDNGGEGSGADITGLEFDPVTSTVTLRMVDSPLVSSQNWFSYYLEVTVTRQSGAQEVLIWENHAGSSRSGLLDADGNASGSGVTLQEFRADFQPEKNPDDPIVSVTAVAFSLVEEISTFTQDSAELVVN